MTLNYDGSLIACTEDGGRKIKIFNTIDGKLDKILHRGRNNKEVACMEFNKDSNLFALISLDGNSENETATLHIF